MDASNPNIAELERLLWRMRDGAIGGDGLARIETLVTGDAEVRRHYIRYGMLCGGLRWLNAGNQGPGVGGRGPGIGDLEKVDLPLVSLSPLASPLSTPFVGGPAFSYMVATVVLCLMLLGGWAYKVSHVRNQHYVDNSRRSTTSDPLEQPELVFVGRVTGMKDCRWSDPDTGTYLGASAPLGREYALASGLMEITYKSGARVILEG
ncbi:MAG: hypothetical protein JW959_14025, partial [Pirellulales bacterium]|nr:hypothetical protein [Pirellulales bacterium]